LSSSAIILFPLFLPAFFMSISLLSASLMASSSAFLLPLVCYRAIVVSVDRS
jgi:hypothetical protein